MKKYRIKGAVLTATLLCIGIACNDILDTEPYDKFTEETVWGSRAAADAFVYGAYSSIVKGLYSTCVSRDAYTTNTIDNRGTAVTREEISTDDDFGFDQFSKIRKCNLIIEKVAESTALSDQDKTELTAEAKFLRAMTYFWLAKRFGRIVWVNELLSTDDTTNYQLPLEDTETTWAKIMGDVDDAIDGMPETSESGRANKYAAYALKTEVGLQAAAYTGDESYFQDVVDAANKIISSGKYALDADYENLFKSDGAYSNETILGIYRSSENTTCEDIEDLQNVFPNTNNDALARTGSGPEFESYQFSGWAFYGPSQNLVDDYLVIDDATGDAVRWDESTQFITNITKVAGTDEYTINAGKVVTDTGNISEIIYNNRDNRFAASIVYDSCYFCGELITTCVKGNMNRLVNGSLGTCCMPLTNYIWRKGVYDVSPYLFYNTPTDYHWVVFRLGKVYLNKAEALLKQGKISEAVTAFNETRTVHGGLPASTASTLSDAWTDYKRERRVDLAKESVGDYYFSLLRWGKYGGEANHGYESGDVIPELEEPATFISIAHNRKSYEVIEFAYNNNHIREFDNTRRYLFPIPQTEITQNPNLTQNEGW